MALNKELLAANAALSALTEEQINTVITLSENDENSVIAKKTGEIYGNLDADILSTSGVEKNGIEKTYDYAKRVISEYKAKADNADALNSQVLALQKEKSKLEEVIAKGASDTETAKQLKQAKADLASVQAKYQELDTKYNEQEANFKKRLFDDRIGNELTSALAGVRFKAGLPSEAVKILTKDAISRVKAMNPESIEDGKGGSIIVFKGENGEILRNQSNSLNPYTPSEMLMREFKAMGVIDEGRKQQGAGSKGGAAEEHTVYSIQGAKTRVEAQDIISKSLMAQGMTIGSREYEDAMHQAWIDNNIKSLPEQ